MEFRRIRTIVVDDQKEMRDSLELYFLHSQSIELVGKATSGAECLDLVKRLHVDIILMDIKMESKKAGILAAKKILQNNPHYPKIIFLTAYPDKGDINTALEMGCSFIDKSSAIPRIIQIIEEVFYNNKLVVEIQSI